MWLGMAGTARNCTVSNLESYRVNLEGEVSGIHRGNKNIPDGMKLKKQDCICRRPARFYFLMERVQKPPWNCLGSTVMTNAFGSRLRIV